ncbi:YgjV family protein [Flavobacterium sp. J27]|uniref:YgjV family protein n=1 Tax=Flavobacterium sp. J27 TaxID=2060419 RepID=UPI00103224D2|nr:YgjV family protein [Flavobacterium sp. J27]
MKLLIEIIGYIAIIAGFYAATKKEMTHFRIWHTISSVFYVVYGFFLDSIPLIISGIIFCFIHIYHLKKKDKSVSK